jgi:predicted GNAT family acetyltransferase
MAGKKDIVEQALKLITEGAAQSSAKQRMIKNLKGHAIAPPREFFRGTVPNSTERIVTGAPKWDSYLFAADNEDDARLYGPSIERIKANPDAKILYEGTADWNKIAGKWRKNENMLQYADRAAKAAREAGYDAAWFKRQGDIGTPIFNVDKFTRGKSEGGRTGYQTKGRVVGSVVGDAVDAAMRLITGSGDDMAASAAKIVKSDPSPAEYIEPGSMRYLYQHPETGSYMEIVTRPKGARSASVIGLEVPEEYRGQGIGKALQGAVLNDFPSLMGQVSSKAAAVNAYKAGRRPIGNPNATIEDIFKMIDEDSSINLATEKNAGGRTGYGPGGVIDDIVKMAGRIVSGADEPAKTSIRAYQGSPHNFAAERLVRFPDKTEQYIVGTPDVLPDVPEGAEVIQDFPLGRMRMDKIGTGEGAQAYGHGLYAAEHEPVARGYRDALSRPLNTGDLGRDLANYAVSQKRGSVDDAIAYLNREMSNYDTRPAGWPSPEYKKQYEDALNILQSGGYKPAGHMYEVNINADPNTFLDWDKPLSEQSEAVKNMLARLPGAPDQSVWPYTTGNDLYEQLRVDAMGDDAFMQATPQRLAARKAAAPEVTRMLGEAGIPGIKYLDAGSRGKGVAYVQPMYKGKPYSDPIPAHAWNQVDQLVNDYKAKGFDVEVQDLGTRNYVVFDDKLISIIRKYGIAGASAMLGYNLMEQLDPKQALAASMADQDYQSSRPQRSMGGNNSISGALNVARGLHGGM